MGKVVQLFKQEIVEGRLRPSTILEKAIADILASNVELVRAINELSRHFDTVEHLLRKLPDDNCYARLGQVVRQEHGRLTNASLQLSQQIEKLIVHATTDGRGGRCGLE